MSIKKSITKVIKDKADLLGKQKCTLTDEELLNALDDIDNMLKNQKEE